LAAYRRGASAFVIESRMIEAYSAGATQVRLGDEPGVVHDGANA
jgi:hypothetical protein